MKATHEILSNICKNKTTIQLTVRNIMICIVYIQPNISTTYNCI